MSELSFFLDLLYHTNDRMLHVVPYHSDATSILKTIEADNFFEQSGFFQRSLRKTEVSRFVWLILKIKYVSCQDASHVEQLNTIKHVIKHAKYFECRNLIMVW